MTASAWNTDHRNYDPVVSRKVSRGAYVCKCGIRTNDGSGVCSSCLVEARSIPVIVAEGYSAADIIAMKHTRRHS